MSNRGTPHEVSLSQFATISSRLSVALPQALRLSGLETKSIIKFTGEGERLALALAEAFKMLYNGHVATIPRRFLEIEIDRTISPERLLTWPLSRQDHRSTSIRNIVPDWIKLFSVPNNGRPFTGDEIRGKLVHDEKRIPLDVVIMRALLRNPERIPQEWQQLVSDKPIRIFFDGITMDPLNGIEHSFFISFNSSKEEWVAEDWPMDLPRLEGDFSAVLEI